MAETFGKESLLPSIPDVRTANSEPILRAMKEWIEVRGGQRGDGLDKFLTVRDLLNAGLAKGYQVADLLPGGNPEPIPLEPPVPSGPIPPTPSKLEAFGGLTWITLTWEFPRGYERLAFFEIWRSEEDALGSAVLVGQTFGAPWAEEVGPSRRLYYWVRAVSDAGSASPFNAVEGTLGETGLDVGLVLDTLEGQITENELFKDLADRIDLIDAPGTTPGSVAARVLAEKNERVAADQAITQTVNTQFSQFGDSLAIQQQRIDTLADDQSATASDVSDLQVSVNGNTAAIQQEASVRAAADGSISGKYSVKVDTNGYVAGFGLISQPNNGATVSTFIIRADTFSIANPTGPSVPPALPFIVRTTATTINGVAVPVGVYMRDGFIQNGTITNAKVGNAAIDNAKIANVSAAKLTAGAIGVSNYIESTNYQSGQSGWRIHGNGNSEFANTTVRGQVIATSGTIGSVKIAQGGLESTNWNGTAGWRIAADGSVVFSSGTFGGSLKAATGTFAGSLSAATGTFAGSLSAASGTFTGTVSAGQYVSGAFTSWDWPSPGQTGVYLSSQGMKLGNFRNNKFVELRQNGDIITPGFQVVDGVMTVSAVNIINTLQLAGEAVMVPRSGAGSDYSFTVNVAGMPAGQQCQLVVIAMARKASPAPVGDPGEQKNDLTSIIRVNNSIVSTASQSAFGDLTVTHMGIAVVTNGTHTVRCSSNGNGNAIAFAAKR